MRTHLSLARRVSPELPAVFGEDDVRYAESLVEYFLGEFTAPGEYVLDPFAGYGTTLEVAERMGRVAFGVELDADRVAYARSRLQFAERMVCEDSRRLAEIGLPQFNFSMTSPPYMTRTNHPQDPLAAYRHEGGSYHGYLRGLREIYRQVRELMLPAASLVLEVSNIKTSADVTPLAWDVANEISAVFHYCGEVIVTWDQPAYGYDHSYCLVFEHRQKPSIGP